MALGDGRTYLAAGDASYQDRFLCKGVLSVRTTNPINGVLQHTGNGTIVFWCRKNNAVSGGDLMFERLHLRRKCAFAVLIEKRKVADISNFNVHIGQRKRL